MFCKFLWPSVAARGGAFFSWRGLLLGLLRPALVARGGVQAAVRFSLKGLDPWFSAVVVFSAGNPSCFLLCLAVEAKGGEAVVLWFTLVHAASCLRGATTTSSTTLVAV